MYRKHKFMRFFSEDAGDFGGGIDSGHESAVAESSEAPVETTQTKPSTSVVDASALAKEFGNVLGEHFKQNTPATPAKRAYTPEEIAEAKKSLEFWEPDDNFIQKFGNIETQKEAFVQFRDGLMKQFMNLVAPQLSDLQKNFTQQLSPVQQLIQQQQAVEQRGRFSKSYPALANEKLQPIMDSVGNQLAKAGKFSGLTEAQAFDVLAKGVEEVIRIHNPEFKLDSPANSGRSGSSIPHTSSGSGGGGGHVPSAGNKPAAVSILGPVKVVKR